MPLAKLHPPPTRTHRQLAHWLMQVTGLTDAKGRAVVVTVEPWRASTDRKAGRLRVAGKGRQGLRLQVKLADPPKRENWLHQPELLYSHVSRETYRTHQEARDWVTENLRRKP